jgi:hypothetical protein
LEAGPLTKLDGKLYLGARDLGEVDLMWPIALFFTVAAIFVCHAARGYWRQSRMFRKQHESYKILIKTRWLYECFPRALPAGAISATLLALAACGAAVDEAFPDLSFSGLIVTLSLAAGLLAALISAVLDPLILLYNVPSFLVAPHDRGKPGGLELRRRYQT